MSRNAFLSRNASSSCSRACSLLDSVRGAVSTKVSDCSSFAGVHRGFTLELVHMEVDAEGQESEVKNR